jgi:aminopeptidase-like protein
MYENEMIQWAKKLYPMHRSITGRGIRGGLSFFEKINPEFKRVKFKSGTKVFDWKIPLEWNIKDSFIKHIKSGKKFSEFKQNNLHVMSYSMPVNKTLRLKALMKNIYTQKNQKDSIPYVTSYYKKNWGFCMTENQKKKLPNGKYKVFIDSSLAKGSLELSHCILPGKSKKEIFFSTYLCHPSMANNELSGPVLLNALIKYIKKKYKNRYYTYRFVLLPETIGSISYLSKFYKILKKNTICGFNLSMVGDERGYTQVYSPEGNNLADKALFASLKGLKNSKHFSFIHRGSDERQYCSPGINLPVTAFYRSRYYPEYHTDKDNFGLVTKKGLKGSFNVIQNIIDVLELGIYPKSKTLCEPFLSKSKLYHDVSQKDLYSDNQTKLRTNIIAYANGKRDIFEIAKILNCPLKELYDETLLLKSKKILRFKNF